MATRLPPTPPPDDRQRMQRVRVGLTGLAAVLLIVAIATAIATGVRRQATTERPVAGAGGPTLDNVKTGGDNTIDPRAEPMAQLGVAPGATEPKTAGTRR